MGGIFLAASPKRVCHTTTTTLPALALGFFRSAKYTLRFTFSPPRERAIKIPRTQAEVWMGIRPELERMLAAGNGSI
uniref:HDC12161 n=1 Tax=Drosophila melanogaster TaxID=7227 RepID=Q6IKL5_DROME|nr:TPA_inf: HDC12161 [Drosophila melanogaster]